MNRQAHLFVFLLNVVDEGGLVGLLPGLAAHLADVVAASVQVGTRTTLPFFYKQKKIICMTY